jgi:molybdopterin-guanine dinucleotide biosynthesis protein A
VANVQSSDPAPNATAIILAGGKSSRMGQAKALLLFDDEPLIVHSARALKRIFVEIVVVAAPDQELPPLPAKIVHDEAAYQGPVAGIYYGLGAASCEFCFLTSCDAPFLNNELIAYLAAQIAGYDVVVPYWEERYQPLHAVYRRSVLPLLKAQLERGELRPIYLFEKVRTRKISEDEIRRFDPDGLSFSNINTPEDYQTALQLWREIKQRGENPAVTCSVELFGSAQLLAKTKTVSVSVPAPATVADALMALSIRLPVLAGRVIDTERRRLSSGYACNINGRDFIRDPGAKIRAGDRLLILAADAGG